MFSDAHAHLSGDVDNAVRRAKEGGVELALTAGISLQTSEEAVKVAQAHDIVYASVGVHPWNAGEFNEGVYEELKRLTKERKVVAISEIGLDFYGRMGSDGKFRQGDYYPREIQTNAFRQQIMLAKEAKKPIIFHVREAATEVLGVLKEKAASTIEGAVHGFSGDVGLAETFMEMRFYISIGRRAIMSDNVALMDVVKRLPMDRLLVETDSSDPYSVRNVVWKIAELKEKTPEDVGSSTTSNLKVLLGL